MKRSRRHLGALAVLLCLLLHVGVPTTVAAGSQPHGHTHTDSSELPPGAFTKTSLYQLESTWITASEQQMRLGELRGKARVLVMLYTSCEYACPILLSVVQNIEKVLPPSVLDKVGFVTVTFDPERDSPAVLRAYGDKKHLDPQRWTLLHGQPDDVLELAVLLGVKYKKDQQGGFAHSNLITVLNKEGEIVYRHTGMYHPIADTLAAITTVAQE